MLQVIVDFRQTRTVRALEMLEGIEVGQTFTASLLRSQLAPNTATLYIRRLIELEVISPTGKPGHYRRNAVDVHVRHDPSYAGRKSDEMRRARLRREGVLDDEWTSAKIAKAAPALCRVLGLVELPRGPFGEPRRVYQRD